MSPSYEFFAQIAQTWGLVYFFVLFIAVLVYALWPSRQKQFDESARLPLIGREELGTSVLALQSAPQKRFEMLLDRDFSVGLGVHARFEIPACAVDLAEPVPTARAVLRRAAVRAARDRAREVHARYLRHRFFLENTNQFMGEHGVPGHGTRRDQPKPSSCVRFKSHGHIPLGGSRASQTTP